MADSFASGSTLCRLMAATRLYDLAGNTPVDWELEAYLHGFRMVGDLLDITLKDAFIQTCGSGRLGEWERLLGLPHRPEGPPEERRALVLRRLAVGPGDNTPRGILRSLLAAGVTAEVDEDLAARKLTLSITDLGMFDTMSDAILEAERMLPAHLTIAFVLSGPNFNQHQGKGRTWQQIDDLDRMWKEIEAEA